MKVFNFPQKIDLKNPILILGSFDTIHKGHLKLINLAKTYQKPVLITIFDNPEKIPSKSSKILESLNVRLQKLANLEIDYTLVIKINQEFIATSAQKFIDLIKKNYKPFAIICGQDYHFGKFRQGNIKLLQENFDNIEVVKLKKNNNLKISTSFIKEQIQFGDIELANSMLVTPWTTNVTIFKNNQFNLLDKQVWPHPGIYLVTITIAEFIYHGIVHATRKKHFFVKTINYNNSLLKKTLIIAWQKQMEIIIKDDDDIIKEKHLKQCNVFFQNDL